MKRSIPLCALLLFGCPDEGTLQGVRPEMVLIPEAGTPLQFDEVVVGEPSEMAVIVTVGNEGDYELLIESVSAEAPFRISSSPARVGPGERAEIFVRFDPTAPGTFEGRLLITGNDPDRPSAELPLRGSARERCRLAMAPTRSTFLLEEIKDVTVSAEGTRDCSVVSVQLDAALFSILDPPPLPWSIRAGETATLRIQQTAQPRLPGVPIRELRLKEAEGAEAAVTLEGEPPLQDCLTIFPTDQLLFNTTPIGQIARQQVEVSNRCAKDARVLSAVIGTSTFFSVETTGFPLVVPALGSTNITVAYHPFSELGDRGVLNIDTNDATLGRVAVELFGQASKPLIAIFPELVDFGGVILRNLQGTPPRSECGSPLRYVQLYSVGDAELHITRLQLDPAGDDFFQVSDALVDGRPVASLTSTIVIPPNKEGRINLRFSPSHLAPPEHESALLIHHNAVGSPTRVVLRGTAHDDAVTTESFTQLDGPRIDLLFVIQNTPLSDDEQQKLAGQVESFVTTAEAANADYHMAVTVTDSRSSNAGKLERCFPHPPIITSTYADQATRIEALECTVSAGITGSFSFIDGMGAARAAIERALDVDDQDPATNPSAGFLRPDAKLMIVVLTTRDDDSVESNALLRDYFLSVKGAHRPDRMAVHALAGPVLGPCPNQPTFFVWPGYRYFWMTDATGGVFFNVCDEDWGPFFDQIGLDVFQPIDEWDLNSAVDPATLVVTIDGAPLPNDPVDGFTYAPTSNSVRFHGSGVPPPGAQVEISYLGLCRP